MEVHHDNRERYNEAPLRESIPPELKLREQWVLWRHEQRDGKKTKVPYNPHTGDRASTTDPTSWGRLIQALEAYEASPDHFAGLGFVFSEHDPLAGVDLDKVRDPKTGAISEWASEWVEAFGGYGEISPSGTGLHIIIRGNAPNSKNQKAGVEAYSSRRFFTFTGNSIQRGMGELPHRQEVLDRFSEKFFAPKPPSGPEPSSPTPTKPTAVHVSDKELLDKARRASKGMGERFSALYDRGDLLEHASHSEARHELLKHLAFWTGWDPERISTLYEGSALHAMPGYAKKWARLRERECQRAIAASPRAYRQEARQEIQHSRVEGDELAPVVAALRAQAATMAWEGRSGPTDRAVYGALLDLAARYGTIAKRGIIISADLRNLALDAGTSLKTTHKSMHRLREERKLIRLSKKSTSKRAAVYLLRYPDAAQKVNTKQCDIYVHPLSNHLSQLRNQGPTTEKEFDKNGRKIVPETQFLLRRLGKTVALLVERVTLAGEAGITEVELARSLKRKRSNVRRALVKALSAGLVLEGEDLHLRVPCDLEWRLERELEESGCTHARSRDARRYDEERKAFYSRRERKADAAPSDEEMERERLQRVQDALDVLQDGGTGSARILTSYLKRETSTFEYVVNAVAFHYGCANSELWREPVQRAVALIAGTTFDPRRTDGEGRA